MSTRRRLLAAMAFIGFAPTAARGSTGDAVCNGHAAMEGWIPFGPTPSGQGVVRRTGGQVTPAHGSYTSQEFPVAYSGPQTWVEVKRQGPLGLQSTGLTLQVSYAFVMDAESNVTSMPVGLRVIGPKLVETTGRPPRERVIPITLTVRTGDAAVSAQAEYTSIPASVRIGLLGAPKPTMLIGEVLPDAPASAAIARALVGQADLLVVATRSDSGLELYRATARLPEKATQIQFVQHAVHDAAQKLQASNAASCKPPAGSEDCFLTTAACGTVGLPDDCWELRVLRAFRDGPLMAMAGGAALRRDYYRRAPRIVAAISARPDARRIWLATYWTGVAPCALAVRAGAYSLALGLYTRMTRRLERLVED